MVMFHNRIKQLREEKNLLQKDIADLFDLSRSAITKWEKGLATPDYATLVKLADFYDVSTDYLLGRVSDRNNEYRQISDGIAVEVPKNCKMFTPQEIEEIRNLIALTKKEK